MTTTNNETEMMRKLWAYIKRLGENGVDIRCVEGEWMIGDNWNKKTQGFGQTLSEAVDNLPIILTGDEKGVI